MTSPITPFIRFARSEAFAGVMLLFFALIAFAWANSPWSGSYFAMKEIPFGVRLGDVWSLQKPLELWVNDALMAVFFLMVGLEIKREVRVGELTNPRQASLAIFAALGGMIVPAIMFTAFNAGTDGARGWGVPMATDIAFALGVLALLGSRVPVALKVFLTALAIVDDLGAVMVIAIFYTANLNLLALTAAGACWALALIAGVRGIRNLTLYGLLGVLLWYFVLKSGLHATIAGVLLALAVPIAARVNQTDETVGRDAEHEIDFEQTSPLHRLEHALQPWVTYLILPIFALFNAGVALSGSSGSGLNAVALGVLVGLLVGKPVGVALFCFLAVRFGVAALPAGVNWFMIIGVGTLAGIGFTMALFITNLAFAGSGLLDQAKIGVLGASVIAAVTGLVWLNWALGQPTTSKTRPARSGTD
jgi:Na+:H+ antiporter, NhaA family